MVCMRYCFTQTKIPAPPPLLPGVDINYLVFCLVLIFILIGILYQVIGSGIICRSSVLLIH